MTDGEREAPGSVWASRQRRARAPRRPLTREAIVETAMRLADAEGLEAVSMRRIATELEARTMSLYHHVARKEDLFSLMTDAVAADVLVPEPLPASWREAISRIVRREREVAQRHPWIADLQTVRIEIGPNMLRHTEQTLAALAELKLSAADALRVSMAVDHYVLGHTMRERWHLFHGDDGEDSAGRAVAAVSASPVYDELAADGELPFLTEMLAAGVPAVADTFEQGLTWLLDGIERDVVRRAQ